MKRSRSRSDVHINISSDGILDNNITISKEYEQHYVDTKSNTMNISNNASGIYLPPSRHNNQYTNNLSTSGTNTTTTTNDLYDVKSTKGKRMHQSQWRTYNIFSQCWNTTSNHTVLPIMKRTLPRKVSEKRRECEPRHI